MTQTSAKPLWDNSDHLVRLLRWSVVAIEAYFVKLGAMLYKHGSGNGITASSLFRRSC